MYATFEEEHGLAKRAMSIYDRATNAVADEDKFEVCYLPQSYRNPHPHGSFLQLFTIYIAKATSNYGLPATRPAIRLRPCFPAISISFLRLIPRLWEKVPFEIERNGTSK